MGRPPTISDAQILQTARKVFSQKGFASATLADIAGGLGVTPAAVLRHFESKQALFDAAMRPTVLLPQCLLDLETIDPATDPRVVLRSVAEGWLPFARTTIVQHLVVTMHEQTNPTLLVPFDPRSDDSPPKRGLKLVAGYFQRAHEAGVIRIEDPRAAALLFMGSLLAYIFIHHVLRAIEPAYPAGSYIDALLDLWTLGAIVPKTQGGSRVRKQSKQTEANRSGGADRARRNRAAAVHAPEAPAEGRRPVRDAGSADGQRRVSRRRPRDPHNDR